MMIFEDFEERVLAFLKTETDDYLQFWYNNPDELHARVTNSVPWPLPISKEDRGAMARATHSVIRTRIDAMPEDDPIKSWLLVKHSIPASF